MAAQRTGAVPGSLRGPAYSPGMLSFVFPGQGSQKPAMGAPWVDSPSWSVVARLSDATGRDIAALLLDADAPTLTATANAQLATFALSLVALDAVRLAGVDAAVVAGHSLGEYSALVAAGVVAPEDCARLVDARGRAMAAAIEARQGTMAAVIALAPDEVAAACASVEGAWVANDNAPGQVVIAGTRAGVAAASDAAKERGAGRVLPVAVSGAFHSPLMKPAQANLDAALAAATFGEARLPVVANVDASSHGPGPADWVGLLSAQLTSPVRWRETLLRLAALGVTAIAEVGPGSVLVGTAKRTVPDLHRHSIGSPDAVAALVGALE